MIKAFMIAFIVQFQSTQDTIQLVNSNETLKEVEALNKENKYENSIDLLTLINEADSNYLKIQIKLVETYGLSSQTDQLERIGSSLMKRNKYLPSSFYITLGNALLNNGFPDKAIQIYKEGLRHFPYYYPLIYNIGYSKYEKEDYEGALARFQEALLIYPFYGSAHQMIGNIMSKSNQRTKAILSYMTYLAINPDKNWALVKINNLVNDAYRSEGSISLKIDNEHFEYYDNLSRSKAALDNRFKSKINLEAPVAQQCELLLRKLKYVEGTDDFWMNFYVPFLSQTVQKGLTQPFLYFILSSANNDRVDDWLNKHEKEKNEWIALTNKYLTSQRSTNIRTVCDVKDTYSHWYFDNANLHIIGKENNDLDVGPYEYYHNNGRLQAKGIYSDNGMETGSWYFYHDNGQLKNIEVYNAEGKLEGRVTTHLTDGKIKSVANYKNGKLDGFWEWYFPCGSISEKYPYEDGVGNGKGKAFYNTGELKIDYTVKDGQTHGSYAYYYKSGQVSSEYSYENGKISGTYKSFHANGEKHEVGQYNLDKATGQWLTYYNNGKLMQEGAFQDDKRVNTWTYYHFNGSLQRTEEYNADGLLNGTTLFYDDDGVLYAEYKYSNDILTGYRYLSKRGSLLSEEKNSNGDMNLKAHYATGQLSEEGMFVGGKKNGAYTTYYRNGNVKKKGTMKDDKWDGKYQKYDESGILSQHCSFNNGTINGYYRTFYLNGKIRQEGWVIDGNIQQKWSEYYLNGELESEGYYVDDEPDGVTKLYGPDGYLFIEDIYDKGTLIGFRQYDTLGNMYNEVSTQASGSEIQKKSPSGMIYNTKSMSCGQDVDDVSYYYPSGSLFTKYEMNKSQIKSYKHYYENGMVKSEGEYVNDEESGEWNYYFDDGKLNTKYSYNQGKIEGLTKNYHENSKIKNESNYYLGKRHGSTTYYDPSGVLQLIKYYKKDFGLYGYQYALANGSLSDTIYMNVNEDKELKSFFQNGKPSVSQQFQKDYYHGDVIFYNSNENFQSQTSYRNGLNHGKKVHYYPNGQVKSDINYYFDEKHGEEKHYYRSGKIKSITSWKYGKQDGWHKWFDQNEKLLSETYYWNGFQY